MTLAELKKKLTVGTRLLLVRELNVPCSKERTVYNVSSVDFMLQGNDIPGNISYHQWPDPSALEETPEGFLIYGTCRVIAEYKWMDK